MPYQFSFYDQQGLKFRENLHRFHCSATNDNGTHCHNICVIGEHYCWIHLLWKEHLRIRPSNIHGAGKGVFAINKRLPENAVIFHKGQTIMNYDGEEVTRQTLDQRYGHHTAPYGVEVSHRKNIYEDGAMQRSVMSCVNSPPNGTQPNCRLTTNRGRTYCIVKATKDIRNGQELYADYGHEYRFGEEEGTHYSTRYVR